MPENLYVYFFFYLLKKTLWTSKPINSDFPKISKTFHKKQRANLHSSSLLAAVPHHFTYHSLAY